MFDVDGDGNSRLRAAGRTVLLLAGGSVAAVGVVVATASLVAGFGVGKANAFRVAVPFGALSLLGAVLVAVVRTDGDVSRPLAVAGSTLGVVGVALFWTGVPAGWTGNLGAFPVVAAVAYAGGLLVASGAGVAVDRSDGGPADSDRPRQATAGPAAGVRTAVRSPDDGGDRSAPSAAVSDGGETGDDLTFFDDEQS